MKIDFRFIRFFVAVIFLFAAVLKYYQLITEPIPPVVQDSIFTPLLELLNGRYFIFFVIEFELCFGLFLLSGILLNYFCFLSLLCFLFFLAISFLKWLSGEGSCGCFGTISVNPIYTSFFDLAVFTIIILFRGQFSIGELLKRKFNIVFSYSDKLRFFVVILIWVILSIPALAIFFAIEVHYDLLGERAVMVNGRERITLSPQNWQNKKFPLTQHLQQQTNELIDVKNIRTIILIHADCPRCQKLIKEYENQNNNNTILIELPTKNQTAKIKTNLPIFKLDEKKDWFAITPCIINLKDETCTSIKEDFD